MATLFQGRRFYLTRSLSAAQAAELRELLERHGGVVSATPADATQLVDYDQLSARRPEWVSADFVRDCVAAGALQDARRYSGDVFASAQSSGGSRPRAGRSGYSLEDDARMLHFAKLRGWRSMATLPASAWQAAAAERVTTHTWQSMHEHFRKKLRAKTPMEQRDIMARASVLIRDRLARQEAQGEQEKTGLPPSPTANLAPTTPAASAARGDPTTPATSSPPRRRGIGERTRQKRKRGTPASAVATRQENASSDDDGNGNNTGGTNGIFFRSVLTEVLTDPSKRACVQAFLKPSSATAHLVRSSSSTESVVSASNVGSETPTVILAQEDGGDDNDKERNDRSVQVEHATDTETDEIICCLQLETNQAMPDVVHALYYCSGDTEMAKAFLKGASPSGMWSQDDDLLLVNLVAEECIDRSAVDAAVARGDFAAMRVPRDTDAILDRVQYLR